MSLDVDQSDDFVIELEKLDEPVQDELEQKEEKDELSKRVEEYLANVKRAAHIRPWDAGKSGIQAPGW